VQFETSVFGVRHVGSGIVSDFKGDSHVEKMGESAQRKVSVKFERTSRGSLDKRSHAFTRSLDPPALPHAEIQAHRHGAGLNQR
jgi:hypothetical protein